MVRAAGEGPQDRRAEGAVGQHGLESDLILGQSREVELAHESLDVDDGGREAPEVVGDRCEGVGELLQVCASSEPLGEG